MNVINGFPVLMKDYYKVYVHTNTFNQATYIVECLNGVAMQNTSFPFIHQVIDDASTDGEQGVIKAWMNKYCDIECADYYDNDLCTITITQVKDNPQCTIAVYFLKKNMYRNPKKNELFEPFRVACPFEAFCEGDDYWTNPQKLQKQVDVLDNNPEVGLVYAMADRYYQDSGIMSGTWGEPTRYEDLVMRGSKIPTLTIMFRTSIYKEYYKQKINEPQWPYGDYPLYFYFFAHSKLYFIPEIIATYRVLVESACHSKSRYRYKLIRKGAEECVAFYVKKYWYKTRKRDLTRRLLKYEHITRSDFLRWLRFSFDTLQFISDKVAYPLVIAYHKKKEHI